MIEQLFTVKVWNTKDEDKYMADSEQIHTYLADMRAAWNLWFILRAVVSDTHIEVRDMYGKLCNPSKGMLGM